MTARHWMQVVALASSLGLTGVAVAVDTNGATSTEDRSSTANPGMDAPSSGAIVTPEDKALGLGKDNARAGNRSGDAINPGPSKDEESTVNPDGKSIINPGPSKDEESTVNPGPSRDHKSIVKPPAVQR